MSEAQITTQPTYSGCHRAGVAERWDLVLAGIEDLRVAVQCILAQRRRNDLQQDTRR